MFLKYYLVPPSKYCNASQTTSRITLYLSASVLLKPVHLRGKQTSQCTHSNVHTNGHGSCGDWWPLHGSKQVLCERHHYFPCRGASSSLGSMSQLTYSFLSTVEPAESKPVSRKSIPMVPMAHSQRYRIQTHLALC